MYSRRPILWFHDRCLPYFMLSVVIDSAKNSYTRDIKYGQCGYVPHILMIYKKRFHNQRDIGRDGDHPVTFVKSPMAEISSHDIKLQYVISHSVHI